MSDTGAGPKNADAVKARLQTVLRQRLLTGLYGTAAALCLFAVGDLVLHWLSNPSLHVVQGGLLLLTALTYRVLTSTRHNVNPATVGVVYGISLLVGGAFSAYFNADAALTPFFIGALTVTTSALLPWGGRYQALMGAGGVLVYCLNVYLLGLAGESDTMNLSLLNLILVTGVVGVMIARRVTALTERTLEEQLRHEEARERVSQLNEELQNEIAERDQARLEVRRSEGRTHSLIEHAPMCIHEIDLSGNLLSMNPAGLRMLGVDSVDVVVGRPYLSFLRPADREKVWPLLDGARNGTRAEFVFEVEGEDRPRIFSSWFIPLFDENGHVDKIMGLTEDVTERHEAEAGAAEWSRTLEATVEERTRDLKEAIDELESFSYTVSHDLRQPLRTVHGFMQLLGEELGENLTESSRDMFDRVFQATRRMDHMIDGLLTLTRLSRAKVDPGLVDVAALSASLIAELRRSEPERSVDVRIGELPEAIGDARLVGILLQNILGNAWKFSRERDPAKIEIGYAPMSDGPCGYFVRDNGMGFDTEGADRFFEPFTRDHPARDIEGTGIGLATAARIVSLHGGEISAEGRRDYGATIRFRLGRA